MKKISFSPEAWRMAAPWMIICFFTTFPPPSSLGAAGNFAGLWLASYIVVALLYATCGVVTILAPLIAHRWSIPAILCALSTFIPLNVAQSGWINFKLSSFIALLGVMFIAVRQNVRHGLVAAFAAASMPASYAFYPKTNIWTIGTNGVVTGSWGTPSHRYATAGLYLLSIVLMFAFSLVMSRGARQKQELQEIENHAAEVDARAELARDLHDVVAHRISMVAVRAETAPYAHTDMDASSKAIFAEIANDARGALDEMREVLGVLHHGDDAQRRPQPQASDIPELFADARSVGTHIVVNGDIPPMSTVNGHIAYRLIQESLTNARRHAPGAPVDINMKETDTDIVIRVSNPTRSENFVMGRGLSGMRERVLQAGGKFTAEILAGNFVMETTLPRGTHG